MLIDTSLAKLSEKISILLNESRQRVIQTINHTMVLTYYEIGKMIASSFSNTFAVLEGGYHPGALERGIYSFLAGMKGQNIPYTAEKSISGLRAWETYEMNLHSVLGFLKPFWKI